jgi:hypothetical protein
LEGGAFMAKRTPRKDITPDKIKEWVELHDKGLSIRQIAKKQAYDVRTVKKYIETSKSEGEFREARLQVLREALVKHYGQLCSFAEKLKGQFDPFKPTPFTTSTNEPLLTALREHLPRIRTWRDMDRWNKTVSSYEMIMNRIKDKIENAVISGSSANVPSSKGEGLVAALIFHLHSHAAGSDGLDKIGYNISNTPTGKLIARGAFGIAIVSDDKIEMVEKSFDELLKNAFNWEDYDDLKKPVEELLKIHRAINEELTRVALRGVLPGKCAFCPF